MTADQLRECREDFMEWFRTTSPQTLDFTLQSTIREFAYQAWKDATIKANTRPTAVASHAEGDWRKADLWVEYAANGNIRYFTQDPESADVHRESIASEGRELIPYYTHPPRSGDEGRAIHACKALLDSLVEFDGVVDGELFNRAYDAIEAAMAARGGS